MELKPQPADLTAAQREAATLVQIVPVGDQFGVTFRGYGPEPAVPVRLFAWHREAEAFAQSLRAALATVLAQPGPAPRQPDAAHRYRGAVYVTQIWQPAIGALGTLRLRAKSPCGRLSESGEVSLSHYDAQVVRRLTDLAAGETTTPPNEGRA